MSGLTNEAPRGEGRRGANRRLLAGGLGSAPVVTFNGRPTYLFRRRDVFGRGDSAARSTIGESAGDGREPRTCATLLLDFAGSASRLIVPSAPAPVSSAA